MRFALNVQPYQAPRNALLDLSPINEAFDTKIRMDQQETENSFRREQMDMQRKQFSASQADRESAKLEKFKQASAGVAQMILEDQDQARAQAQWQRLRTSDPRWDQALKSVGVDPNDYRTGAQAIIGYARGYQDPLDRRKTEAQIEAAKAQAAAARAQAGDKYTFSGGYVVNTRTGDARPVQQGDVVDKDLIEREGSLRKEFSGQQTVKDFTVVRDAYSNVKAAAAEPSAAGDLSLIFSYMKLLDPQSVVREQEFANAQNAAGVPDRIRNVFNRILSGERLNPEQRADFIRQAEQQYQVRERQYQALREQYRGVAKNARARPDQVILDYGVANQAAPPPPGPQVPSPPRPRAVNPQTGETIEWNGQRWERVN